MRRIAYFMNSYPMTSTTFIRREIEAHERRGLTIKRYAVRRWSGALVDPADIAEQQRTDYLLSGNAAGLMVALLKEIAANPGGVIRALGPWLSLLKKARGGFVRHVAYVMQAALLKQRAKRDAIDHIHVHFSTNAAAVAMLCQIMGGPSYSFTVHGPDELTDAPLLDIPAKVGHAGFVAAITNFCKSQLIRFSSLTSADKIEIIHCGLDLRDFTPSPPPDNQTFVCVGRLCPQKGQAQLPAVAVALRDEFPQLKIILIGDGESRAEIEAEIARLGVAQNIVIKGWMENAKVRDEIKLARAFLLPSFAEGLPVVIMEALALGRPVISTYVAGIPELVDEGCGWIVPAGDQAALIGVMGEALRSSPETLAALGAEGRKRIEAQHDIDKEAAKLAAMFERAVCSQRTT
ncbi:glycosyltransferase [Hyphococcus sp.]|uniref:glycosyltransferase n=1 Tax=Hyphococcus sp. TaxID=2038636 RepID=UPI002084C21D|nr:MAG: colanic acid biosynthesis glycosyltransferase WcaL [Marinicaulis sp.]